MSLPGSCDPLNERCPKASLLLGGRAGSLKVELGHGVEFVVSDAHGIAPFPRDTRKSKSGICSTSCLGLTGGRVAHSRRPSLFYRYAETGQGNLPPASATRLSDLSFLPAFRLVGLPVGLCGHRPACAGKMKHHSGSSRPDDHILRSRSAGPHSGDCQSQAGR